MSTVSWRELLTEAASRVGEIDARRIVEEASGFEGGELYAALDRPASRRGVAALDRMVQRRADGEPLQYVLGRWSFRNLDLFVDRRVLIPRPETEVVAGVALEELARMETGERRLLAVDLGTGSGAIGLSIVVESGVTDVVCTDVSSEALAVARANLAGLGRSATGVTLCQGSWFEALAPGLAGRIDLIVSNPPYVRTGDDLPAEVADFEPVGALIAGPTGTEAAEEIIAGAPRWLRSGGSLVLELAPDQLGRAAGLARAAGFGDVGVRIDLAGRERVLVAR